MTKTEYLYGKDFDKRHLKMQIEICEYKLEKIEKLLKVLLDVPIYARDDERLGEIVKARDFNQRIIDEEI